MDHTETNYVVEIDFFQLLSMLWKKAWIIVASAVIFGGLSLAFTKLFIAPVYTSQIIMYVNNQSPSAQNQATITQSDLNAAQHLVDTYTVFLRSRTTLDEVLAETDLPYTYEELNEMITADSVGGTEAFQVMVRNKDPKEAALIANTIGDVLPGKISAFIPGSSATIVDYAVVASRPSSPNVWKNAAMGVLCGILVSGLGIVVVNLMDRKIHNVDYLTRNYNIPVLASIPNIASAAHCDNGYYTNYGTADSGSTNRGGKNHA